MSGSTEAFKKIHPETIAKLFKKIPDLNGLLNRRSKKPTHHANYVYLINLISFTNNLNHTPGLINIQPSFLRNCKKKKKNI